MNDTIEFIATMNRCIFDGEKYKIYAMNVDDTQYHIKHNKYNNVTISGSNIFTLEPGIKYIVKGKEVLNEKFGWQYEVESITADKCTSLEDTQDFLRAIINPGYADSILAVYPDFVQKIQNGEENLIDTSLIPGVGEKRIKSIISKVRNNFLIADVCAKFYNLFDLNTIKKLYNVYGSTEKIMETLRKNPYSSLTQIDRVGFRTADVLLKKLQENIDKALKAGEKVSFQFDENIIYSKDRCLGCIQYYLNDNEDTQGSTKMKLNDLKVKVRAYVPEAADYFDEIINDEHMFYRDIEDGTIASISAYNCEKSIAEKLINGNKEDNVWGIYQKGAYATIDGFVLSEEQQSVQEAIDKNNVVILSGAAGCVDCDTEFFNGTEWKKISDYQVGDKVLQYNKDGTAELVNPIAYIKKSSNRLYEIRNENIDMCISNDHKVVYLSKSGRIMTCPASYVIRKQMTASNGFNGQFINAFEYSGQGIDLTDLGIELVWDTFINGDFEVMPYWYQCSNYQLRIICDKLFDREKKQSIEFSTIYKQTADFIQFVFSSCRYNSAISVSNKITGKGDPVTHYTVKIVDGAMTSHISNKYVSIRPKFQEYIPKDGFQYCFTVPSHMWIMRRNDKIVVTGNCGKSSSVQALCPMLAHNNKNFAMAAPSAKAAKVLKNYSGYDAKTIHRMLGYTPDGFIYQETNPLPYDLIIIDETSMVDVYLFLSLLKAIDFNKTKLLLIGDYYQIKSVGAGSVFRDLIQSEKFINIELTKIFRYGESGILTVATDSRNNKSFLPNVFHNTSNYKIGDSYIFIPITQEKSVDYLVNVYSKLLETTDIEDIIVITPLNKGDYGTIAINNKIQERINKSDDYISVLIEQSEVKFKYNDIVLNTVNDYKSIVCDETGFYEMGEDNEPAIETLVANGETGKIVRVSKTGIVVKYDENFIWVPKAKISNLRLGYAISSHKSQGSGYKTVILLSLNCHSFFTDSSLLYTSLTRAKKRIIHIGNPLVVNRCVKAKTIDKRLTNLKKLIENMSE